MFYVTLFQLQNNTDLYMVNFHSSAHPTCHHNIGKLKQLIESKLNNLV